ncbi:MAG: YraN family protein [Propionibacteriaceae bacterium]|nr:YraN family protein [Propionibacteriaceae bacterium]
MNHKQTFGRLGEQRATEYLLECGWQILERNWSCKEGEADIIAVDPDKNALVVVEVKTRAGTGYGSPLESITYAKARRLRQLAAIYARQSKTFWPKLRVDAIGILWPKDGGSEIRHARGIEER